MHASEGQNTSRPRLSSSANRPVARKRRFSADHHKHLAAWRRLLEERSRFELQC